MYSSEIINMSFVSLVSGLVKNFNTGIFSDTITVINVHICIIVLIIEFYMCIPLSFALTYFMVTAM